MKIAWWEPQIGTNESKYLSQVLESNYLNEGEWVERFEHAIAKRIGARFAVATTSGTSALFVALAGCKVGPGDEVLVPDITFIATANAVRLTGATPVLVDVDRNTFNLDPARAEAAITHRTKAIVPVHVSGRGADMERINRLAESRGLVVIEDAAEALGSLHRGRPLGRWSKAGCFSFSPNKLITTGQGGMVVTDDESFAVHLRELKDQGRPVRGTGGDDTHHCVGYNFKMTNLQAAVGVAQLENLDARLQRLQDTYRFYRARLDGVSGLRLAPFDVDKGESPQWVDAYVDRRDALHDHLLANQVHCRKFWHPLHTQAPYRLADTNLLSAIDVSRHGLWLPSAFTLSEAELDRVCKLMLEFLN